MPLSPQGFDTVAGRDSAAGPPQQAYRAAAGVSARLWAVSVLLMVAVVLGSGTPAAAQPPARYQGSRRCMGVTWQISVYATDAEVARKGVQAALDEVSRLEQVLSDYLPTSELCRLSAAAPTAQPVSVGDDLWQVLVQAVALREQSGGAFDPTVGPLTTLWRQARQSGRLPAPDQLDQARRAVGPNTLTLHQRQQAVCLHGPGMRLDLGGIGMGFAIDRALAVVQTYGITVAMVDASGDIGVIGCPPGKAGWQVRLDPLGRQPQQQAEAPQRPCVVTLVDAAITTSGDAFQAVVIDGVRYSHIVDPRTGLGVIGPTGVTVIAPTATQADAVATTLSVLGPGEGLPLVEGIHGASARFVRSEDGKAVEKASSRWPL